MIKGKTTKIETVFITVTKVCVQVLCESKATFQSPNCFNLEEQRFRLRGVGMSIRSAEKFFLT